MAEKLNTNVVTPEFRVSYPSVFKAKRNDLNGKDEFSVVALFKKGIDLSVLKIAAKNACINKWGPDESKWPKGTATSPFKNPFRDQAEKVKEGKLPDGLEMGAIFMTYRSTTRPGIVDQNKQEIMEPSKFYAGCWARASVNASAFIQKGNAGVSFYLNHLQFVKDGPPFSARPSVESAFEAIAVEGGSDATSIF